MILWWPGEWDRVILKVDNWLVKREGYSKIQPRQMSRGYQSMACNKKPANKLVCSKYRFSTRDEVRRSLERNEKENKYGFQRPSSIDIVEERCLNSLDKMDRILKQYEKAFSKLPKRGPKYPSRIFMQQVDILNEETVQKMFLKCYNAKNSSEGIVTNKV